MLRSGKEKRTTRRKKLVINVTVKFFLEHLPEFLEEFPAVEHASIEWPHKYTKFNFEDV